MLPASSTTPADASPLAERVRALAAEAAEGTPLYVVDVVVKGRENARTVEVVVDADAGAGLDDCAALSRRLGFLLDTEDAIAGRYTLTVTSPGADRPLSLPRQFPRHVGRTLRVSYGPVAGDEGEDVTVEGTLREATPDTLTLDVPGRPEPVVVPFGALRDARVVLPW